MMSDLDFDKEFELIPFSEELLISILRDIEEKNLNLSVENQEN